jgi:hypothetical protein
MHRKMQKTCHQAGAAVVMVILAVDRRSLRLEKRGSAGISEAPAWGNRGHKRRVGAMILFALHFGALFWCEFLQAQLKVRQICASLFALKNGARWHIAFQRNNQNTGARTNN